MIQRWICCHICTYREDRMFFIFIGSFKWTNSIYHSFIREATDFDIAVSEQIPTGAAKFTKRFKCPTFSGMILYPIPYYSPLIPTLSRGGGGGGRGFCWLMHYVETRDYFGWKTLLLACVHAQRYATGIPWCCQNGTFWEVWQLCALFSRNSKKWHINCGSNWHVIDVFLLKKTTFKAFSVNLR